MGKVSLTDPTEEVNNMYPTHKQCIAAHQSREIFTWAVCAPKNCTYGSGLSNSGAMRPHASGLRCMSNSCCCKERCCSGESCECGEFACWMSCAAPGESVG